MPSASLDREIEQRLKDHDTRYTKGRRSVIAALADTDGPRSAAELHTTLGPDIPLSSLYRSLAVLEEAGILEPHYGAKGLTRFELAEWLKGHHHHLVCINCGAVEDLELPQPMESNVDQLVAGIGKIASFTPMSHTLEIEGRCGKCA